MRSASLSHWEELPEEHVAFLDELERFCQTELAGTEAFSEWDHGLIQRCAALGLQSVMFDGDHIAAGRLRLAAACSELVASYRPALAMAIGSSRIHSLVLSRFATDDVRKRWLPSVLDGSAIGSMAITEAEAGTDVRAVRTVAKRTGDGWTLTGAKEWVTLGPVANFSIVLAKIEDPARSSEMGVFIVERDMPGVSYGGPEALDGFDAVPVGPLNLDEVAIPASHVVAPEAGFARIMDALNYARMEAGCLGVGMLRGALRTSLAYALERVAFEVPIAKHQAIQLTLGRMATALEAARALLYRTTSAGVAAMDPAQIAALKAFSTDAAFRATSQMVSVLGATGLIAGSDAMQLFQASKAAQIFDGTSDILYMNVAKALTRQQERLS